MRMSIGPLIFGWLLAEILGFMLFGAWLGFWGSLGVMALTCITGMVLIQLQGVEWQALLREAAFERKTPQGAAGEALLFMVAALLLIIPGFFSDLVGLILLPGFVREHLVTRHQGQAGSGEGHRYRIFMNDQEQDPHRPRRRAGKDSGKTIDGSYREL